MLFVCELNFNQPLYHTIFFFFRYAWHVLFLPQKQNGGEQFLYN